MAAKKIIKDKPVLVLFDEPLLKRLDAQAKRYGVSRGAMIRMVATSYLEQQEKPIRYPEAPAHGAMFAAETSAPYNVKPKKG